MRQEQKAELKAWLAALGLHGIVFILIALSGVFLLVRPSQNTEPVEVALWEDSGTAGGAEAGGGSSASISSTDAAPMEAVIPTLNLPQIQESYTKEPQKQQEYRQQHQTQTSNAATSASGETAGQKQRTGTGFGNGDNGRPGQGIGSGTDNGSGSGGSGVGNGSGTNTAPAERVAARCIYRPSPAYPESLRQQGVEGSVQVMILVAENDAIESVTVVNSSGYPDMDAAAVRAAQGCRFQMNGRRGRYTTTYRFQLADGDDW
ncbi:MAG: energy transducer TonB [Selenomonas sp.]|uniref:energy transducer TonB n=1 Tax=Selenomonas sp. TaxID=2053611 RepID=UPI0025E4AE03|nr:energy transducer TonB [Selenomonas sp.]MCR5757423.1 energy transducer TonB [Selenomonas sp.]